MMKEKKKTKINSFTKNYSEGSFWKKLLKNGRKAGMKLVYTALLLYYILEDKDVPFRAKAIIIAALGYFVFPLDAIVDITPVIGYSDDISILLFALSQVVKYVSPEIKQKAGSKIDKLFRGVEFDHKELIKEINLN